MADQQQQKQPEIPEKSLPPVHRYVTTHGADGRPTFASGVGEEIDFERSPLGADLFLAYSGAKLPVPIAHDADLDAYKVHRASAPGPVVIPGGFVSYYVDYHPGCLPPWHRTATLDLAVVVEGQVQLELEGGEKRISRPPRFLYSHAFTAFLSSSPRLRLMPPLADFTCFQ